MARNENKNSRRVECSKCKEMFEESEVDIVDGDWICRNCEAEMER